jgi:hypothetical protein
MRLGCLSLVFHHTVMVLIAGESYGIFGGNSNSWAGFCTINSSGSDADWPQKFTGLLNKIL